MKKTREITLFFQQSYQHDTLSLLSDYSFSGYVLQIPLQNPRRLSVVTFVTPLHPCYKGTQTDKMTQKKVINKLLTMRKRFRYSKKNEKRRNTDKSTPLLLLNSLHGCFIGKCLCLLW